MTEHNSNKIKDLIGSFTSEEKAEVLKLLSDGELLDEIASRLKGRNTILNNILGCVKDI